MAPAREPMRLREGRRRVVIEGVQPEIDCGRFAIKRITGDRVTVEADVFADGHDALTSVLAWRREANDAMRLLCGVHCRRRGDEFACLVQL